MPGRRSPGRARPTAAARPARGAGHSCSTILAQLGGQLRRVGRVVLGGVGDAEAAAEVELGQRDAELVDDPRVQARAPGGRRPRSRRCRRSASRCGECRPTSSSPGASAPARTASSGVARGEREAELLVLVRGRDELVGVRLDADGHPDHHRGARPQLAGEVRPAGRSRRRSRRRSGRRPRSRPGVELARSTCCCRGRRSAAGSKPGAQRDRELAAGADVEAQALLGDPARDRRAEERLAGVEDVGAGERLA